MTKADFPSPESFRAAAWMLACDASVLQAIAEVEAGPGGAFLETEGQPPVILFERHKFSRHTRGRFDGHRVAGMPDRYSLISHPTGGGYGPYSVQHAKLQAAAEMDRDAALKSASWGLFQILGENHAAAGYPELQRFINAMYRSVDDHLRALVMFIRNDARLVDAVREKEWTLFARVYNGPTYWKSSYDERMASAWQRIEDGDRRA